MMEQEASKKQFILHCGIEVVEEEGGYYTRVEIAPEHLNPYGIVHGGLMYTMADTATGLTAGKYIDVPVTLDSDFHFLSNVSSGVLTAKAEIIKGGKHVMWLRVRVVADDKLVLAEGTFTYYSGKKKE
jgi:acyl-CoA thioesterase